jgi:hypothetical protein
MARYLLAFVTAGQSRPGLNFSLILCLPSLAMSLPDANDAPYDSLGLPQKPRARSAFFCDTASSASFAKAAALSAGFLLVHVFAALRVPPLVITQHELVPLDPSAGQNATDVNITLANRQAAHRAISVNCSLISTARSARPGVIGQFVITIRTATNDQEISQQQAKFRRIRIQRGTEEVNKYQRMNSKLVTLAFPSDIGDSRNSRGITVAAS